MLQFRKCRTALPLLFCFITMGSVVALAQRSAIVGTVTDSSGAALAGAAITAKNVNTGETWNVDTKNTGEYAIPNLNAGVYTVSAEKQGFDQQTVEGITLEVQLVRTVNLVLPVGIVTQRVTVAATPTALQTSESSVSTLFEPKVVEELPLNGRDFLQLQLLAPGTAMGVGGYVHRSSDCGSEPGDRWWKLFCKRDA